MATLKRNGLWAAILALGLAVGCGGGNGESASPAPAPTASQTAAAQNSNTASSPVTQSAEYATDALVESGAPGSTSAKTGSTGSAAPSGTINYQASVSLTVDLDAPNSSGQDAHPNASGVFQVNATGSITGDSMNGQAQYSVQVIWQTNGVFTDPVCGAQATVLAGSQITYSLTIQWSKTDDFNWSIQATYDVNGSASGTVSNGGHLWNVSGSVTVHASATFSRTAGTYSFTFSINGQRTITVDDGVESHTVTITVEALDRIFINVDGVVFGPYTAAQIWWIFHFNCRG
jgi:hypothetical protein